MGQLPSERLNPVPPFTHVGIDFAGPFLIKRGKPCKPTIVNAYACLFFCFSTKATHLELVSDMTIKAFLATLIWFVVRRGCPLTIISDNGANFLDANKELKDLGALLQADESQRNIYHFTTTCSIQWNSPLVSLHTLVDFGRPGSEA